MSPQPQNPLSLPSMQRSAGATRALLGSPAWCQAKRKSNFSGCFSPKAHRTLVDLFESGFKAKSSKSMVTTKRTKRRIFLGSTLGGLEAYRLLRATRAEQDCGLQRTVETGRGGFPGRGEGQELLGRGEGSGESRGEVKLEALLSSYSLNFTVFLSECWAGRPCSPVSSYVSLSRDKINFPTIIIPRKDMSETERMGPGVQLCLGESLGSNPSTQPSPKPNKGSEDDPGSRTGRLSGQSAAFSVYLPGNRW